ncbi:MAG: CarD family transcriptional regulator [Eubacterium sp.]|nr:CarD family transcriptional regulator [Eubacterium sp.]
MFSVGDYVVYGSNGVCRITDIGPMDLPGVSKDKLFYTMTPCYIRDSSLFTPIDNPRVIMRPVMTKDEAESFVESIKDIDGITIKEEKHRELEYKEAVLSCDPEVLVGIIKTIYGRMNERIAEGKKVTSSDSKYFHIAEDSLYGELAISLGIEKDEVKNYIHDKIES